MPGRFSPHDGASWPGEPWAFAGSDAAGRGPSRTVRLWLPVVASGLIQLAIASAILRGGHHHPALAALTLVLAVAGPLALIAARRFPGPVVALVAAISVTSMLFAAGGGPLPFAFGFALAGAVVRGARVWAWVSLAVAWVVVFVVSVFGDVVPWPPPRVIGTVLGLVLAIGLGELLASRRARFAAFRAAAARRRQTAAEEERMRIARELHDVLAHSLSQINVQAGVGLHLAGSQPEKAVEALASIKRESKIALDDVRSVLGVLRADGEAPRAPHPGIAGIAGLVASTGIPGAEIIVENSVSAAELPAPVGAAAYRIVQEGLTNVARHGVDVSRVVVRIAAEDEGVLVEVSDDGRDAPFVVGRGLTGMRERVEQLGGSFETVQDGGFTVRAHLPTSGRQL